MNTIEKYLQSSISNHGTIEKYLQSSISNHGRLCPRQILGVRIGLAGGAALGLDLPRRDKALLVIAETDGCFISGLEAASGCAVHHRTLKIEDLGKVAATFVSVATKQAVRVVPRGNVRNLACDYSPNEEQGYFAQLKGYPRMPDEKLLSIERVSLNIPVNNLISQPGLRVHCNICQEEVINQREIIVDGKTICRTCAGYAYYKVQKPDRAEEPSRFEK